MTRPAAAGLILFFVNHLSIFILANSTHDPTNVSTTGSENATILTVTPCVKIRQRDDDSLSPYSSEQAFMNYFLAFLMVFFAVCICFLLWHMFVEDLVYGPIIVAEPVCAPPYCIYHTAYAVQSVPNPPLGLPPLPSAQMTDPPRQHPSHQPPAMPPLSSQQLQQQSESR